MLLHFSVENFRSIKEEQRLIVDGNNVTGIYGANGSGKSNLIAALSQMLSFISPKAVGSLNCNCDSFKLAAEWQAKPSTFKLEFIVEMIHCEYKIVAYQGKIQEETLNILLDGKWRTCFLCTKNTVQNDQEFVSEGFTKKYSEIQSYLFMLAQEGHIQALSIYNYFEQYRVFATSKISKEHRLVLDIDFMVKQDATLKSQLNRMMELSDIQLNHLYATNSDKNTTTSENPTIFDLLQKESSGTVKLYYLGAAILATLKQGGILIIDDISSSLHTKFCTFLIGLFQNSKTNSRNSQLIFTSHRPNLMNTSHPEGVHFTEKDKYGATHLFAASDFDGVTNETPLDRWYLQGKFGATPNIKEISFIYDN